MTAVAAEESDGRFRGPFPGQQTKFFERTERILFYGGAGGGGKSVLIIAKFLQQLMVERRRIEAGEIVNSQAWGLYLRRNTTDLKQSIDKSHEIFLDAFPDAEFNINLHLWTFPSCGNAKFEFGHVQYERSVYKYKSNAFCSARGTHVVMGDGSTRQIQDIRPGDLVQTLEGPRRVTHFHETGVKPCVSVTTRYRGETVGKQVHPTTHPVLLWPSIESPLSRLHRRHHSGVRESPHGLVWQDYESLLYGRPGSRVERASTVAQGTDCAASGGSRQELSRLPPLYVPAVLHAPTVRQRLAANAIAREPQGREAFWPQLPGWQTLPAPQQPGTCPFGPRISGSLPGTFWNDISPPDACDETCARPGTGTPRGSAGHCSTCTCPHDEPALGSVGDDPVRARLLAGVAAHSPSDWRQDDRGHIRGCKDHTLSFYPHFYRPEVRPVTEEVLRGEAEMNWAGWFETFDLTVDGANHYITTNGLVNCQTYIALDELTEFTETQYDYMDTRLRTTDPVLEPMLQVVAASNPDGVGLLWVRKRFVDNKEPETVYRVETKTSSGKVINYDQIFIPAKLRDNPPLYKSGHYEASLMNKRPEVREAILEGNWYIAVGAFLGDVWDSAIHVCPDHEIPRGVSFGRSGDFGIRNYGSYTWWYIDRENAFTAFHNLYCKGLTAEQVAVKIKEIERHYGLWDEDNNCSTITGPLDEDCFNRPNTSGPNIAEAFRRKGVRWRRSKKDRFNGAAEIIRRLEARIPPATENDVERPMIRWMERCKAPIETLPVLMPDPNDANDVDTKGEDHCWDDTYYMCLWRPLKPVTEDDEDDDDGAPVIDIGRRRRYGGGGRLGEPPGGWR